MALTQVAPGKWEHAPERREVTSHGEGHALTLYVSPRRKTILCVEWRSNERAGKQLAANVRRVLEAASGRKWHLSQRRWNRIYIE
jgi:hypothetical protein